MGLDSESENKRDVRSEIETGFPDLQFSGLRRSGLDLPHSNISHSSSQNSAAWHHAEPARLIELTPDHLPQICSLEKRCYPSPWSDALIAGEFQKPVSFRLGLVRSSRSGNRVSEPSRSKDFLLAYSFNYLVADELHILNLAVRPECRGLGLGRQLFCLILQQAYIRGGRYATLEVRETNSVARKLYESVGFKMVGLRRQYYRNNQEDALVLELALKDCVMALVSEQLTQASSAERP